MKRTITMLFIFLAAFTVRGQDDLSSTLKELQSRVQTMSQGYYSDADWVDLFSSMKVLAIRAEARENASLELETALLRGLAYADIKKDYDKAREVLEKVLAKYGTTSAPQVTRVYIKLAEIYSIQQDGPALERIKARFRSSPLFDETSYSAWGGSAPGEPIAIVRPNADGPGSSTLTAMEKYRDRMDLAVGTAFPPFEAVDHRGRTVRLADLKGQVVLVDFWVTGWRPWLNNLTTLKNLHKNYSGEGLTIIGVNMNPLPDDAKSFVRKQDLDWPMVYGNRELLRRYRVFGEAQSFLLNREGTITGKDLSGSELVEAVKRAL